VIEIRRIAIQSQPKQIVHMTLSQKKPSHKKPRVQAPYHKRKSSRPPWAIYQDPPSKTKPKKLK
jgi:hypothetical protein